MELRKLKALLAALQAAGVTSYHDGDLALTFGAAPMQVPKGDIEGTDESWKPDAPMGLAQALKRIEDTYAVKPGKARAQ